MVENTAAPAPAGVPDTETVPPARVSLKQFCIDLSMTDRRVELIGGFEHSERIAGRVLDTVDAFKQRYADFSTATPK